MAVAYWMISNRDESDTGDDLGGSVDKLRFFVSDGTGPIDSLASWTETPVDAFQKQLAAAANRFPDLPDHQNEDQRHVCVFIHGYNNSWKDAAQRYKKLTDQLFTERKLGICILFTWPSKGTTAAYLPDREEARDSANDAADVFSRLYDWLLDKQTSVVNGTGTPCKAKTSVIAHSMGNYVLQCAMQTVWTRKNQPLLVSLLNQTLMVAADVDNDLFKTGESVEKGDGEGLANLSYRITALYSGRDSVLGMSAGLKHFGKRRLGRSGLDRTFPLPDNVWDVDCSSSFPPNEGNIHSAYFEYPETLNLMEKILRGIDRNVILQSPVVRQ